MNRLLLLPLLAMVALGCNRTEAPERVAVPQIPLTNRADSVAMRAYEAVGGPQVWAQIPYLRFNFGSGTDADTARAPARRHLWNRHTGDYRLEIPRGDTLYTVLFNVNTREGQAYRDGAALDTAANEAWLRRAYSSFINDTYWLLVPTKLFDEGVIRTYVPDSSNAEREAILLTFSNVGLTPGDRYWVFVDQETGRMTGWSFKLEGSDPNAPPNVRRREGYETFETPYGQVALGTRHVTPGSDRILYTDGIAFPESVPAEVFTDPNARID